MRVENMLCCEIKMTPQHDYGYGVFNCVARCYAPHSFLVENCSTVEVFENSDYSDDETLFIVGSCDFMFVSGDCDADMSAFFDQTQDTYDFLWKFQDGDPFQNSEAFVFIQSLRAKIKGHGVGSEILKEIKAAFKGKEIYLSPKSKDKRQGDLNRFYKYHGFKKSVHDDYLVLSSNT